MRKLCRSRKDRIFLGVCGGLAQYWDIDPTLVRFLFVIVMIFSGVVPLLLCYLLAALIIPLEQHSEHSHSHRKLFRSRTDRKVAGICGGLAKLLRMDSTVVRVIAVLLCVFTGVVPFLLIYLISWIIIPEEG